MRKLCFGIKYARLTLTVTFHSLHEHSLLEALDPVVQDIIKLPGRVAQSVGHLTRKSGVLGSIPGLATYFRFSFRFSRRAVVSYWRKYVHEVLLNRLGGLSLPRKSVVRLTDRPDVTLDVYSGRKTIMQQCNIIKLIKLLVRYSLSLLGYKTIKVLFFFLFCFFTQKLCIWTCNIDLSSWIFNW